MEFSGILNDIVYGKIDIESIKTLYLPLILVFFNFSKVLQFSAEILLLFVRFILVFDFILYSHKWYCFKSYFLNVNY